MQLMAGKKAQQKAKPQPLPTVGGSFVLNRETGEWIRSGELLQTAAAPDPVIESNDGSDS